MGQSAQTRSSHENEVEEEKEASRRQFNLPAGTPIQIREGKFDPEDFKAPPGWKARNGKGKGKSAPAKAGFVPRRKAW